LTAGSKPKKSFLWCVIIISVSPLRLTVCKIGKDLLLVETPLTLRLIGLRVTKLKDLRVAAPSGIKRVCDAVKTLILIGPYCVRSSSSLSRTYHLVRGLS
jgi:hypothetical protein